jgi:hypothetical protein
VAPVGLVSSAVRCRSRQIGWPSLRQWQPSAQRGSCSPGYHLPWPKCSSGPWRSGRRACGTARRPAAASPAQRQRVPLRAVHVVDRDEGRLAAHGELEVRLARCRARSSRRRRAASAIAASL